MAHRFAKYEGLGNDFLVVEQARFPEVTPALAARLCDRHFGVGGDGVLLTGLGAGGGPFMRVVNADGSVPEMCGNGLRCVALYLVERQIVREDAFEVDTDAGPHAVRVLRAPDGARVEVQMRPASLDASLVLSDGVLSDRVPSDGAPSDGVLRAGAPSDGARARWVEREVAFDGRPIRLTAVSMGNPHVVTFDDVLADAATLGPRIERDARFRAGANVGFARLRDPDNLELTVWERGVGFTLACGTGACAAAVAAVETGRVARGHTVHVHLPGGPLAIRVPAEGEPISMTGPARHVFDGEV